MKKYLLLLGVLVAAVTTSVDAQQFAHDGDPGVPEIIVEG